MQQSAAASKTCRSSASGQRRADCRRSTKGDSERDAGPFWQPWMRVLWRETFELPAVVGLVGVAKPVMETIVAVLPELEDLRD